MFILGLLARYYLRFKSLPLSRDVIFLFLDHLMVHHKDFPISLTMELLMGHPMGHLMELLMDSLMDRSMDRTINPMGMGIKNLLTLPIMAM